MQRTKTEYLEERYGIAADNLTFVEKKNEVVVEGDQALYDELLSYIETHDLSEDGAYDKICEMIDMQSFLDYFAVNIYIGNTDWPNNNSYMWRSSTKGRKLEEDTKWRWMIYDVNDPRCMNYDEITWDTTENAREDVLFAALLNNARFRQAFYDNLMRIEKEVFDPERVNGVLFRMATEIELYMQEDYLRFPNQYSRDNIFAENVQNISDYFRERDQHINAYVMRMLEEYE